jgi:hypothetical protein
MITPHLLLLALTSAPLTPSPGAPGAPLPAADDPVPPGKHFVFANHYGLSFGLNAAPSGELTLFFGHAMPARARGARRWALGYQPTFTVGGADRYLAGMFTQRHHLTALSHGGLHPRLHLAFGGGLVIFNGVDIPARWRPSVAEAEGQIGYLFGRHRARRRVVGVVGLKLRLGWNAASLEKAPVPMLGGFLGLVLR